MSSLSFIWSSFFADYPEASHLGRFGISYVYLGCLMLLFAFYLLAKRALYMSLNAEKLIIRHPDLVCSSSSSHTSTTLSTVRDMPANLASEDAK
jgi:hypothetical protein